MSDKLSPQEKVRLKVIQLHGKGLSNSTIARRLSIDTRTVQYTIQRFNESGSVKDRARTGRPKKLSAGDRARLLKKVKGRERQSSRKTSASFKSTKSGKVSKDTIRRNIRSAGLIPHRKKRRPKLTVAQKEKRVEFATKYLHRVWDNDVFWDEKEFELEHTPNVKDDIIWDERGKEYFFEETKFPKAYKVGLALSSKGISRVVPYEGTIDSNKFQNMVVGPIDDMNELYAGERWRWVMDKATCHTSRSTQQFMAEHVPSILPPKEWPANSPDISPIENFYGDTQAAVDSKHPETLASLKRIVNAEFKRATPEKCQKFISALPGRLKRIIKSKGEYCY